MSFTSRANGRIFGRRFSISRLGNKNGQKTPSRLARAKWLDYKVPTCGGGCTGVNEYTVKVANFEGKIDPLPSVDGMQCLLEVARR